MSSAEENKAIVRRFLEEQAKENYDIIDELVAPDFVDRSLMPGQEPDREGYKRSTVEMNAPFSDINITIEHQVLAALLQGDHERAGSYYRESLMLCKELGTRVVASESLRGLACISVAQGATKRATRLFGAAAWLREAVYAEHYPEEDAWRAPYLADARSRLDEAAWEEAWAQGRAMSMEQAIEYALSEEKPVTPPSPESEKPPSDEPPSLTSREKEVAILVARGLTNRQIAFELVLSEHTVHHHVTNILKKLNLSTRQQVASRLTDR